MNTSMNLEDVLDLASKTTAFAIAWWQGEFTREAGLWIALVILSVLWARQHVSFNKQHDPVVEKLETTEEALEEEKKLVDEAGIRENIDDGSKPAEDYYLGQLTINRLTDIFDATQGYLMTLPEGMYQVATFAVVGRFNVGKTYLVNKIAAARGATAVATGDDVHTRGISFKIVDGDGCATGCKMLFDSEGADTPVTRFDWSNTPKTEQLMTGALLQECASVLDFQRNLMFNMADGIIIVVNQVTCTALTEICNLYLHDYADRNRKVILVHNMQNVKHPDTFAAYKKNIFGMFNEGTVVSRYLESDNSATEDDKFSGATYFMHISAHDASQANESRFMYAGLMQIFLGREGTRAGTDNEAGIKKIGSVLGTAVPTEQNLVNRTKTAIQQLLPQYVELPAAHVLQVAAVAGNAGNTAEKRFIASPPEGVTPKLIHREVSDQLTRSIGKGFAVIEKSDRFVVVVDVPGVPSIDAIGRDQIQICRLRGDMFSIKFPLPQARDEGLVVQSANGSSVAGGPKYMTFVARMPDVNYQRTFTREKAFLEHGRLWLAFLKQIGDGE